MQSCPPPRVRWAGLRSNAVVDMFGRGAAVTFILFSSGNAQHAVPRTSASSPLRKPCVNLAKSGLRKVYAHELSKPHPRKPCVNLA